MATVNRWRALRVGGAALVSALAGCAGGTSSGSSGTTELGELAVENLDDTAHTVRVLLLDGGDIAYWADQRATPSRGGTTGGATFTGYPSDAASDVLHVRVDDQPQGSWNRLDLSQFDSACLGVSIKIAADGTVSIYTSQSAGVCAGSGSNASN